MRKTRAALADSERMLSGGISAEDEGLGLLGPHIEALRRVGRRVPTEAHVEQFAGAAARLVQSGAHRGARGSTRRITADLRRPRLGLRLAGAAAALVLLLCTSAGVAYAADHAAPGDALYSFDLALEDIGLGDDGLPERLSEASELVERGRIQEGLALAGEAIAAQSTQSEVLRTAADALRAAANAAPDDPSTRTPEAQALTAAKLRWLAAAEPTGDEFVQAVYDLAGSIRSQGQGGAEGSPSDTIDQDRPDSPGEGGGGQGGTDTTGNAGHNGPKN